MPENIGDNSMPVERESALGELKFRELVRDEIKPRKKRVTDLAQKEALGQEQSEVEKLEEQIRIQELQEAGNASKGVNESTQSTYQIENSLELGQAEQKNENKQASRFGKWFRRIGLGLGLLVGGVATYEGVNSVKKEHERQTIEKSVGFDLKSIAEKHGFKTELQVKNGDGRYLIHIGQVHGMSAIEYKDLIDNFLSDQHAHEKRDYVVSYQKQIEGMINELQENGYIGKDIYDEGIAPENLELLNRLQSFKSSLQKSKNEEEPLLYHRLAEFLEREDFNLLIKGERNIGEGAPLRYIILSKIEELEKKFGEKPPQFNLAKEKKAIEERDALNAVLGDKGDLLPFQMTGSEKFKSADLMLKKIRSDERAGFWIMNKDAIYFGGGAAMKLFLDGKINIKASEDPKANDKAVKVLKEKGGASQEERKKHLMDDREDAFLDILSSDFKLGEERRITSVIYGRAHNFTRAIEEHNKKHPDQKIGLVRIDSEPKQ